ncbi:hypothetical protein [Lentzea albidocapillata]|uniref:Uncharacterized protein n=1 Tax=Lentzea albidocapillata TaxID=40571 RepID=A0A1W2F7E8_9PSEU|nr:hypothetical protein [Lentzea albidocapillata]SMD17850.1 hypothetical protein SAMN05660733_05243 [Lentzea albidocapillata]
MDPRTGTRVAEICALLEAGAPAGWNRVTLDVWANVMAYELATSAQDAQGRFAGEVRPAEITDRLQELREQMYEEDRGTWLSARFVLRREAAPEVTFNYDEDPRWSPELHPMMFVRDLEAFPRADEHLRGWLRETVERGLELQRAHEVSLADQ